MLPWLSTPQRPPAPPLASLPERLVPRCLALLLAVAGTTCVSGSAVADAEVTKHPCSDVASYYQGTEGLEGERLRKKLFKLTRNHHVLPYKQTWDALKLLDSADSKRPEASSYVFEVYSQRPASKNLAGKLEGWTREHLWPGSYGLKRGHPEFSDLHNLRPADANVNSARGKKYFGECNPATDKTCLAPAFGEAAVDTATNRKIWMPPSKVRGDVARSLMYMVIRYGLDKHVEGFHLQLSDTPNEEDTFLLQENLVARYLVDHQTEFTEGRAQMGKLSVLLKWNLEDPPSDEERLRNSRVCTLFQHNRNPFVDHPEFALRIWGASHSSKGK